jgi:processive 1,2-diacylglycerol beta-glucosyltransferase
MKVIVLSISTGEGHNSTAKAICEEMIAQGVECSVLDAYKYINKIFSDTVEKGYLISMQKAQHAYSKVYRMCELRKTDSSNFSPTRLANSILANKIRKYMEAEKPDAVIYTHVFVGIILDILRTRGEFDIPSYGVVTDFAMHPFWEECVHLDYIVTANHLLDIMAIKKGFRQEQIISCGIPIKSKFAQSMDKRQAKQLLGYSPDKPLLLIMSGSMGFGKIAKTVQALDESLPDFQMVVVCGNNKRMYNTISKMKTKKPLSCFGFVNNINELMDAADCIISKPGGLSSSEALAKRLPMIIIDPIPGIEDRNTEFFLNAGAAIAATKTYPIDEAIYQIFTEPKRLEQMRQAIEVIRRPDAAKQLCQTVIANYEKAQNSAKN